MDIGTTLVVILGLALFEIISSVDNAVVNAHVLKTLPEKFRKFFLTWGILFAVFVVRGVLPFLILWIANPALSMRELLTFAFSADASVGAAVEDAKGLLLLGGGVYLVFVFLGWLFLEEKKYAFLVEHFIHRQSVWFYAIVSVFLTSIIYFAVGRDPMLALSASIGASAFFITDGFRHNAEKKEKDLLNPHLSAWSKIMYLEVLDTSFSIDGVIGAFAFTLSIPLIIIGNGLGALVVLEVTVRGINLVGKFAYLKNGAMYAIGMLGALMTLESFGREYPAWLAPLNTFLILSIFLYLSWRELRAARVLK